MFLRAGFFAFIAITSLVAFADAEDDTVTIPLKDIWAWNMPGTKDIRDLEPDIYGDGMSNISEAERKQRLNKSLVAHIGRGAVDGTKGPEESFAVVGTGHEALKRAYAYFHDNKLPQTVFTTKDEISLVFFSYTIGSYVHLDRVERQGTTIRIYFRFVAHMTKELTEHVALIPLGKLPVGKYDVKIIQLPVDARGLGFQPDFRPVDVNLQDKFICKPFSFSVK